MTPSPWQYVNFNYHAVYNNNNNNNYYMEESQPALPASRIDWKSVYMGSRLELKNPN